VTIETHIITTIPTLSNKRMGEKYGGKNGEKEEKKIEIEK